MYSSKCCAVFFALLPLTGASLANGRPDYASGAHSLREILLRVSMDHPRIRARAQILTAALKKARYSSWKYPDPRIGVFWWNAPYKRDLRFIKDKTPMTGVEYRLSQMIPFPGRLTVASKVADEDAHLRRLQLALEKNRVAAELLELLIAAEALQQTIQLTSSYEERMRITADVAQTRYAVGKGNLVDVSRAALKAQAYSEKLVQLRGDFSAHLKKIAYYLAPAKNEAEIHRMEKTIHAVLRNKSTSAYVTKLNKQLPSGPGSLETRSLMIALGRTKVTRAEKEETLARMNYLPDFEVFASYRKRAFIENDPARGEDFMSFGVTVRVPLWSALSNRHTVAARDAWSRARRLNTIDLVQHETAQFRALRVRRTATDKRIKLYSRRLVPTASRARDSAQLAYETGKSPFDVFLNSWDTLYTLEAERVRLEAKARRYVIRMAVLYNQILPRVEIRGAGAK